MFRPASGYEMLKKKGHFLWQLQLQQQMEQQLQKKNSDPNDSPKQFVQQLMQMLEKPSDPDQHQIVLNALKTKPKLMEALIKQLRAVSWKNLKFNYQLE
jgi:Creb binding